MIGSNAICGIRVGEESGRWDVSACSSGMEGSSGLEVGDGSGLLAIEKEGPYAVSVG